jgi:uncharacterized membrane protein SpoIIM required for sporulation/uncharacterized RDD family membrane protein YckC
MPPGDLPSDRGLSPPIAAPSRAVRPADRTGADAARRRLEQHVDIETPEQVVFSYTVAGIGSRAAAALLDYLIIGMLFAGLGILFSTIGARVGGAGGATVRTPGGWALAVIIFLAFALQWGYYVVFEAIWDGQTPGKRRLGIRVVQDGGYSVSFAASAVRNILRIVDMQPGVAYAVGIVSAVLSRSGKRLGDLVAGTFVVHERVIPVCVSAGSAQPSDAEPAPVSAALTAAEYELLDRFLARQASLDPERRRALTAQLAARLAASLRDVPGPPLAALIRLHERETAARRRGLAPRGATGAARERDALVAQRAGRWSAFAASLAHAQRRGLRNLSEEQVSELVARYRELTTDLARLRTAAQGAESEALFTVSRLVAAGHNLLYRQRALSLQTVRQFVFGVVPRELRRSAVPIVAAAVCLFGPMAVTYHAVVARPGLAESLLPARMIDRAHEGVARARRGERTYVAVKDFERPVMASAIIANNVQVTYAVFGFGLTAGLLTVAMLIFNGVSIGAGFGLYASLGIFRQIGEFVLAHSVFELSAICIAAGGGFRLAQAILLPGPLTRREALVARGRGAIALLAASTMLLVLAGLIEGLISPRTDIPLGVKAAVAGLSAFALAAYVSLGWRAAEPGPTEEFGYSDARALISR